LELVLGKGRHALLDDFEYGILEVVLVNGFEEVVDGTDAEGFGGVFVVAGHENDLKCNLGKALQKLKTIHRIQRDVEKYQVGLVLIDADEGIGCGGALVDDFDLRTVLLDVVSEGIETFLFVIN